MEQSFFDLSRWDEAVAQRIRERRERAAPKPAEKRGPRELKPGLY